MVKNKFVRFILVGGNLAIGAFIQPIIFTVSAIYEAILAVIYKYDFEDYRYIMSGFWAGTRRGLDNNIEFIRTGDLNVFFNIF